MPLEGWLAHKGINRERQVELQLMVIKIGRFRGKTDGDSSCIELGLESMMDGPPPKDERFDGGGKDLDAKNLLKLPLRSATTAMGVCLGHLAPQACSIRIYLMGWLGLGSKTPSH